MAAYRVPIAERLLATPSAHELSIYLDEIGGEEAGYKSDEEIECPCPEYKALEPKWAEIEAVLGGTIGLRPLARHYLPIEPNEDDGAYRRRVSKAVFTPWYQKLRDAAVAQILRRPIQFSEDTSDDIESHLANIDLQRNDINSFCRKILTEAIDYGSVAILVDYPRVDPETSLADISAKGYRPYWVPICAKEVIDVIYEVIGGKRVLVLLKLCKNIKKRVGKKSEMVEQIHLYELASGFVILTILEENEDEEKYVTIDSQILTVPYIPIVPLTDFFCDPLMLDIACLNIKHYQKNHALDHSLHIAGNPKFVLYGYVKNEGEEIQGDVNEAIIFEHADGRAEWVVCKSVDFEAQERSIEAIEHRMAMLAISQMAGLTAQGAKKSINSAQSGISKQMDRVQSDAMLSILSQALQDTIDACLVIHCHYLRESVIPTCEVNKDFQLTKMSAEDVKTWSELLQLGQVTQRLFLEALKDGEWLLEEADVEEIIEKLNNVPEVEIQTQEDPTIVTDPIIKD